MTSSYVMVVTMKTSKRVSTCLQKKTLVFMMIFTVRKLCSNKYEPDEIFSPGNSSTLRWPVLIGSAAAKSLQSCPTLCDPIDGNPPGSAVPGILQARILEWVAISFSKVRKWKVKVKLLSRVWLLATPWTAAYQAPPSMGLSRQEYWSRVPLPSPEDMLKRY